MEFLPPHASAFAEEKLRLRAGRPPYKGGDRVGELMTSTMDRELEL